MVNVFRKIRFLEEGLGWDEIGVRCYRLGILQLGCCTSGMVWVGLGGHGDKYLSLWMPMDAKAPIGAVPGQQQHMQVDPQSICSTTTAFLQCLCLLANHTWSDELGIIQTEFDRTCTLHTSLRKLKSFKNQPPFIGTWEALQTATNPS